MNNMQALLDGLNTGWQRERAESQLTLGGLIAALEAMLPGAAVPNISDAHSYRGYYCDLEFKLHNGTRAAAELLAECKSIMGKVYEGYKGGDYVMGANTPLWIGEYGSAGGIKLIAIHSDGSMKTETEYDGD